MLKYPFVQPMTFLPFRFGRVVLLLSILGFAVFVTTKDIVFRPSLDDKTFQSISMAWGLFTVLLAIVTMFLFVLPERIEAAFTRRAHIEATLYNLLMQINKKGTPEEVRITLFEAYLTCLRRQYELDPEEHLRHIPDVETDALRRVCAGLITKEKLKLAESVKGGLTGVNIQREGLDIERLETMNTVLNERFKENTPPQSSSGRIFDGMATEA